MCSIKELQFFKYPHGEQSLCNVFFLGGGGGWGTSCKLAVFDLGKEASFGLSFKRIEK